MNDESERYLFEQLGEIRADTKHLRSRIDTHLADHGHNHREVKADRRHLVSTLIALASLAIALFAMFKHDAAEAKAAEKAAHVARKVYGE